MAPSNSPKATSRQLAFLRALARQTGTTFSYPSTKAQASTEIKRLKTIGSTGFAFAEVKEEEESLELYADRPLSYGPAIRDHEITGYGCSATWSRI